MGCSLDYSNTPDQYSVFGPLTGLSATIDFSFANGQTFNVINENTDPVTLSVKFAKMDTFVPCLFQLGPNPYLIKAVEHNAVLTADQLSNLKYGY